MPAAEVFFSNPMKSRESIAYAAAKGVEWYVTDSVDELRRIHEVKPDAKQYLRIATPNIGSDWPLSGKFGAGAADAREIVAAAAKLGVDLAGVTFHVGSQCRNPENWRVALEKARTLFDAMTKAGLKPRLLNIGGGYPVRHVRPIPSIEVIGEVVNEGLKAFPDDVQVIAEPGRYLVSDAGYFVCRVLGTATRAGKRWMHWDAGLFGGVIESSEGLRYRIRTDRSGPGHRLDRGRADLRLGGHRHARRAAAVGPAGRRLRLHPQRRRLHHGLREPVQRLPAARGAGVRVQG